MTQQFQNGHIYVDSGFAPHPEKGDKNSDGVYRQTSQLDASIQEAREKLTHRTDARPEFEYELLYLFAQNSIKASIILPVIATIVALASLSWTPANYIAIWLGALFFSTLALIYLCNSLIKMPRKKVKVHIWRKKIMIAELLHGISWGAIALFGLTSGDHRAHMFVFVTLSIVNSLRMMLANAALSIVYVGTLPIILALFFSFWYQNTPFYWAMASMALGTYIFFIYLMSYLHSNTLTTLMLRSEKDALIAELEQSHSVSEEGRRRAEAANLAKSRFLATMSHELRTPLNAIIGFSEMMKDEMLGGHNVSAYKGYSEDIHNSGKHLLNLINEILDITRIEAGKYDLNEEAISLPQVLEECCYLVKMRADAKRIMLRQNYQNDLERLWADERAIRQIALNLLSNAIKFTPTGGTITITAGHTSDRGQYLSIKDNGPGIPQDELPRVLTSFGQGSLAHENAEGGTGLGLPIVKGLIKLHDGRFDLKTKMREGTEVIAMFPKSRVLQVMPQIQPELADNFDQKIKTKQKAKILQDKNRPAPQNLTERETLCIETTPAV
ncbi:MAG: ATP-binding protein [Hyphomicrobiaceae bacterium]|nr:ATP-binding protein [Hyphomicrobiaceae bacterium]